MKLAIDGLQYVPVDTIICFRASIPLVVAIIEYIFLGRELPTLRSWISLSGGILIASGAAMSHCRAAVHVESASHNDGGSPTPYSMTLPASKESVLFG